jgi:hypothetical protein
VRNAVDESSTVDRQFSGTEYAELVLDADSATKRAQPQRVALKRSGLLLANMGKFLRCSIQKLSPHVLSSE